MKPSYSPIVATLGGLLATCLAAPPVALTGDALAFALENGYIQTPKQIKERTPQSSCQTNEVYKIFKTPPRSAEASDFCSSYIRPTPTVTSTSTNTIVLTETTTQTETDLVTTTATATIATVTELCATPTAPVTCGFEAFGFGSFLITSTSGLSGLECHRLCLVTAGCKSFQTQTGGINNCNLFNVPTAGNVQPAPGTGFTFYDRDCTDLLPAGCTLAPSKNKRTVALFPSGIAGRPASQISAACTCLITSAPPATSTFTSVVPATTVTTTTDVVLTTVTSVQTDSTEVTYVTYTTV